MTTEPVCHAGTQPSDRHEGPAHPGPHTSCSPCPHRHCASRATCGEHVTEGACPRCVGHVRTDLARIAAMHAQLPAEALHHPSDPIPGGTAAVLAGPWSLGESGHVADETGTPDVPAATLATWVVAWQDVLEESNG